MALGKSLPNFNLGKNTTPLLVILLIVASFLLGSLWTKVSYLEGGTGLLGGAQTAGTQETAPAAQPGQKVDVEIGHLPTLGNKDAKVTMIEFSDFQCPFCRSFWRDTLPQIKKEYIDTGKVRFAYRHLPLDFHAGAVPAAEASECANEQGKFWEMHDKIFEEQDKQGTGTIQFTTDDVKKWAKGIGLNLDSCLDSKKYSNNVTDDLKEAQRIGANGTPTFVINGQVAVGAQPFESFKAIIDAELTK